MTFDDLGLSDNLLKTLKDKGYTSPTPIQAQIIPLILRGSDVLACAPTGTGKTASFSLPLVEILTESAPKARLIRCLILVPTRELATQVCETFKDYSKNHKLRVAEFIGGASIMKQKQMLSRGVDVAIATPGRFLDLYETGNILPTEIKNIVIDEADRMMDMGFLPDLRKILAAMPKMRQTVLLSATMPPAIKKLAQEFLMSPKEVMVAAPASTALNITQYFVNVPSFKSESDRLRQQVNIMRRIFEKWSITSAIIFCNKKHHVDKVYQELKKKNYAVEVMHGDLTQSRRNRSLENMKSGESQFLVASDVAARGIDISNLPCVVNMEIPMHIEDYVHRIGRTGRAGAEGLSFTMVTKATSRSAHDIIKMIGKKVEFINDYESIVALAAEDDAPHEPAAPRPENSQPKKPFGDSRRSDSRRPSGGGDSRRPSGDSRKPRGESGTSGSDEPRKPFGDSRRSDSRRPSGGGDSRRPSSDFRKPAGEPGASGSDEPRKPFGDSRRNDSRRPSSGGDSRRPSGDFRKSTGERGPRAAASGSDEPRRPSGEGRDRNAPSVKKKSSSSPAAYLWRKKTQSSNGSSSPTGQKPPFKGNKKRAQRPA